MNKESKQYPEGHFTGMWMGIGIALFSGIGIPLSIALGSNAFIGIGPAIGIAIGLSIGAGIESRKKEQGLIRPLNEKEKKQRRKLVWTGIIIAAIGLGLLLWMLVR
jgi:hypothetical protein